MFSRTALSSAFRQAARPARNPLQSSLFAPLQIRLLSAETRAAIDKAVGTAPVVLFMKGTPETPQCGFSRASIQILGLQGVDPSKFTAFNVLEDEELRQGIKEYSEWPTIPQLYVNKEFVGGCDILMSMHQDGSLAKMLEEKDVLVSGESSGEKCDAKRQAGGADVRPAKSPSLAAKPTVPLKSPAKKQKRFVSTSALFTQKHNALPKPAATRFTSIKATRPAGITKTAPGAGRGSTLKKAAVTSRKQATTYYREGVASSGTEAIAIAHSNLQARLADPASQDSQSLVSATGPGSAALRAAVAKQLRQLSAPLTDELLKISNTSADGTTTETSCRLGASIATFQARVLKEEKTLKVLKKQWAAVQHEILARGIEVLGPGWFTDTFGADNTAAITTAAQSCGSVAESTQSLQALELETRAKTAALKEDIEITGEDMLEKLERGERELDAQRKEQRRAVLAYMQTQL